MNDIVSESILEVLREEREDALSGDFDSMKEISKIKEVELRSFQTKTASKGELILVSTAISRNQGIIEAMIAGVKSAQKHVESAAKGVEKMNVYNRTGELETFDSRSATNSSKY